jgi:hypothetical protein
MDDPRSPVGDLLVVGDQEQGLAGLRVKPAEKLEQFPAGTGIEVPGRFIGQNQPRIIGQGPGYRHPLLFTPGKLGGVMFHPLDHPDQIQKMGGFIPQPVGEPGSTGVDPTGHHHILPGLELRQQIKELEDKPDLLAPEAGPGPPAKSEDILTVQMDLPRSGKIESTQDMEQGTLPRPRGTGQNGDLSFIQCQVDAFQDRELPLADPVNPGYSPRAEKGAGRNILLF